MTRRPIPRKGPPGNRMGGIIGLVPLFLVMGFFPLGAGDSPSLQIGVIGALTGPKAVYGLSHLQGALLAAEEINAGGGFRLPREGFPKSPPAEAAGEGDPATVRIVSADDGGDMGAVGVIARDLVYRDKVRVLIGSTDSGCTHVLAMVAVKIHIPHLTCVATDPSITRAGSPWTFRTLADDSLQARALVGWLPVSTASQGVVLLAGNSRYGRMGAGVFARLARERGIPVSGPHFFSGNGDSNRATVFRAVGENPAAVILWMLAPEGLEAVRLLRASGYRGRIAGGDGLATPAFFGNNPQVEGVVVTNPYPAGGDEPGNAVFRDRFSRRFGTPPDSFAAHAYDTVRLVASAAQRGGTDPEDLRRAIGEVGVFPGVTGPIGLDSSGNDTRHVSLAVCRAGNLVPMSGREE